MDDKHNQHRNCNKVLDTKPQTRFEIRRSPLFGQEIANKHTKVTTLQRINIHPFIVTFMFYIPMLHAKIPSLTPVQAAVGQNEIIFSWVAGLSLHCHLLHFVLLQPP